MGIAKIIINIFHMSAVKFEKPSPVAILAGRRPRSLGILIVSALFCIIFNFVSSKILSPIQSFIIIHLATPRNRQYIGSTTQWRIGLKLELLTDQVRSDQL